MSTAPITLYMGPNAASFRHDPVVPETWYVDSDQDTILLPAMRYSGWVRLWKKLHRTDPVALHYGVYGRKDKFGREFRSYFDSLIDHGFVSADEPPE